MGISFTSAIERRREGEGWGGLLQKNRAKEDFFLASRFKGFVLDDFRKSYSAHGLEDNFF